MTVRTHRAAMITVVTPSRMPARTRRAMAPVSAYITRVAMLIAAMCALGTSTIVNAQQIERGYERIDERLNALGARITRVPARGWLLIAALLAIAAWLVEGRRGPRTVRPT